MGTSQSSSGPGSNLPIVPAWVPDPEDVDDTEGRETNQDHSTTEPLAPRGRFGSSRRNLSRYAKTGEKAYLRRGFGQYIKSGYHGAGTATKRFGGTVSTAGVLYNALSQLDSSRARTINDVFDYDSLLGSSPREIIDTIIQSVEPTNGTLDSEARQRSINDSITELLNSKQDVDLMNLNKEEVEFVIEKFVSNEVFKRFELDLGLTIQNNAPSIQSGLSRLKEIREYIQETISASFREIRNSGETLSSTSVKSIVNEALRESFEVFEGYA